MSDHGNNKGTPTTTEVAVNWEGLKRFMGWEGTITELKRVELDSDGAGTATKRAATGE